MVPCNKTESGTLLINASLCFNALAEVAQEQNQKQRFDSGWRLSVLHISKYNAYNVFKLSFM